MSSELVVPERLAPATRPAPGPCIHEVFERQAKATPKSIALSWGGEALTYSELNEQASQVARHLQAHGVGPEVPVALYLERTPRMVVAILGVLKAGGAYVPIDLAYPMERAQFMLEDAKPPMLLTQEKFRSRLPSGPARVLCLDSQWEEISAQPAETPAFAAREDNIAYIIYTSGSTGKPKGVLVTHRNVVRLLRETAPWYGFNARDVWPLFHSYAFDVSVWELWGALFHGGRLVVLPYLVTRSPGQLYEVLAQERVTVLNQTPSAFRQLIWAETVAPAKLELSLRWVICAGEALELQSLRPWFDRHGDEKPRVVNMYGITETTVHSTYRVIRQTDLDNRAGSVIGVPIPDLKLYLVDDDLKPVPPGTPGEICVGGPGVARGYLNRPELTRERFIPDPFSAEPEARLYRSGDLAQRSAAGELEYLGRMDGQVKIRGFRVELGEIESVLNSHPAVRESVVLAREAAHGEKRLVAYVVPVGHTPTVTELREHLGRAIPDYMLPAHFVPLERLPLTTNGKVDRRALPSPEGNRPELRSQFVPPRNEVEQNLARIWSEVLGISPVGIEDNFFELGGDSIRSISVLAKAQQAGLNLALEEMFRHPTVAGLAALGAERRAANASEAATTPFSLIPREDRAKLGPEIEDAFPCAKLQLGMFFRNELDPKSPIYHDIFSYRVEAPFDQEKFERAAGLLVGRHPTLRSSFRLTGFSEPLQLVHRKARAPITLEDLRGLSGREQASRLRAWLEAEKRRPFDREQAPLLRLHTQALGQSAFQLIISFHHSCLDGWSLAVAVSELLSDYSSLLRDQSPELQSPAACYRDFVALERRCLSSEGSRSFWTGQIKGSSPQLLPRWPKDRRGRSPEQARGPEIQLRSDTLEKLKRLARSAGTPLKSVLLAAHLRVMSLLYGQDDVISGLISNGRPEERDGEELTGLFLNTLPFRLRLDSGSWLDLVRNTFAAERELIPHRRFPLAEIQKLNGGRPLFETAFDFVHFHILEEVQRERGIKFSEGEYFEANDLTTYTTFMLDPAAARLELHIDYNRGELCRQQVEEMSQYYVAVLEAMAAAPLDRYDTFSPLSEAEKRRMLADWNATEAPNTGCIHQLFEQRVAETPEATALVFEDTRLSYRELNWRAERLARRLVAVGVKNDVPVGVYIERSPNMVIALLAILKAGGAYVPLDPHFPRERIVFMLQDCGARTLLTDTASLPTVPETSVTVLNLDESKFHAPELEALVSDAELPSPDRAPAETRLTEPSSLAYIIYTSGSTGRPKGVQVVHSAVVNLLISAAKTIGFGPEDNLFAVTTLSFDIAALEIFIPLITGARLTLASRAEAADGTRLASLIESSKATTMQATPATWRLLIESGWKGKEELKVLCGGEALKPTLAGHLLARTRDVWNFYGPTETTIWSSAWKLRPAETVLIGRPLANTKFYILDSRLRMLPVGTVGELFIGGAGLARGYLGNKALTDERFIPNPFSADPGERIYRTGDLARYTPDGEVELLGRIDSQVKVRGFRIELGEVEAALRAHHGVAEALVIPREDALGEQRLIGYVTSRNGALSPLELREFVRGKLPHYMVPARIVALDHLPLTPNGKTDFCRLPAPESVPNPRNSRVTPRTENERRLAEIWKEVLMLDEVGAEDNFFELGGDSLSATRAFARINRSFRSELTLREMLEHPTIAALALVLQKASGTSKNRSIPRLPRRAKPSRNDSV